MVGWPMMLQAMAYCPLDQVIHGLNKIWAVFYCFAIVPPVHVPRHSPSHRCGLTAVIDQCEVHPTSPVFTKSAHPTYVGLKRSSFYSRLQRVNKLRAHEV